MYQNPANESVLAVAGDGSDVNNVISNNPNVQIMDPIQQQQNISFNGMQSLQQTSTSASNHSRSNNSNNNNTRNIRKKPYVKILEQPASKALRFRYECEGRSAGSIPGVNSTSENKTYPTIEIVGYKGRAVVVVSCITKDPPYRPHPHNLVGKEGCKKGVCTVEINSDTMRAVFSNLGIQCVKKKDIDSALKAREDIRVDPFKTGFSHRYQPSSIDLNSVRLCFQVFLESEIKGRFTQPLAPVVSDPIYDKKAMSDLVICRLCSCSSSVLGNTQIILLCEKVAKDDISVRFYEEKNGQTIWEAFGEFQHSDVHKQTAITFKTPRYRKTDITEPAKVLIQLKRPSDGVTSEALPFEYVPLETDLADLRRKRQKTNGDPIHLLLQQQKNQYQNDRHDDRQTNISRWNAINVPAIKTEPRDVSPQEHGIYRAPPNLTPSPQPVSPSNAYTHNTQVAYSMASAVTTVSQRNQQIISPNQQYNTNNVGPQIIDVDNYNVFCQQQQQQYHGNNFGIPVTTHWETKFNTDAVADNNMSNLNNANTFTNQNLLIPANTGQSQGSGTNGMGNNWNLPPNLFPCHHQHHLQQQQQPQQQQYQHHEAQNNTMTTANNTVVSVSNVNNGCNENRNITNINNNNNEHGLSNLLTFDSEQLVRINSEDQQMLRLNTEDLQISSLSIST